MILLTSSVSVGTPGQDVRVPFDTTADSSWLLPSCEWNLTGFWNETFIEYCEDIPGFYNPNSSSTANVDDSDLQVYTFNLGGGFDDELGQVHIYDSSDLVQIEGKCS